MNWNGNRKFERKKESFFLDLSAECQSYVKEENSEAEMGKEKLFVETKGFPAEIQIFRFCPQ